jgi:hypothetical protein
MRRVSGCTWNWRTSPPMGITWATPGMDSSRGRSTQSAYSRTAMGVVLAGSMGMAMSRISPMMEETGAMRGVTAGGRAPSRVVRRSATICRAR